MSGEVEMTNVAKRIHARRWSGGMALIVVTIGAAAVSAEGTVITGGLIELSERNGIAVQGRTQVTLAEAIGGPSTPATGPWTFTQNPFGSPGSAGFTAATNGQFGTQDAGGTWSDGSAQFYIDLTDPNGSVLFGSYNPVAPIQSQTTSVDLLMRFEVTINDLNGGMTVSIGGTTTAGGAFTVRPSGGTTSALGAGDYLSNGAYTIEFRILRSIPTGFTSSDVTRGVLLLSSSTAPSAIPGSGLAAIGTLGLAGIARRRRR